jgi:phosphoribosylformimino-5-aminoimidazole carboxamide ribonucleotide (ProFAR) isomerase
MLAQLDGTSVGVKDHAMAELASFTDCNRAATGCIQSEMDVNTVADNAVRGEVHAAPSGKRDAPR